MSFSWSEDIINILQRIKFNSVQLNKKHTEAYKSFQTMSRYFDLPVIVLSVFSSSFQSLGAIDPTYATMLTTAVSMFIAILSSTKLYLNLTTNINNEIDLSKSYYILSINIYKMLSLRPTDQNPRLFLDECFSEYTKLIEQSSILIKDIKRDLLTSTALRWGDACYARLAVLAKKRKIGTLPNGTLGRCLGRFRCTFVCRRRLSVARARCLPPDLAAPAAK